MKQAKCCQTETSTAGEEAKQKEKFLVALAHTPPKHIAMMVKANTAMLAD